MTAANLVVTGAGVVCPLGCDLPTFTRALKAGGASGIRAHPAFARELTLHQARRLDRLSQLLVIAAREAAAQARFDRIPENGRGVVVGTGLGCLEKTAAQLEGLARDGLEFADPMGFPDSMGNAPAAHVAMTCAARGVSFTVMEREIAGESAVVLASRLLRAGAAKAILVVAGDASSPALEAVLARLAPGIALGEGAGAIVIESEESALDRKALVLARLRGYATEAAAPGPRRLHAAKSSIIEHARASAMRMAGLALEEVVAVPPETFRDRTGWFMADGIVHSITAIAILERADRLGTLVTKGARGSCAAALVFGKWKGNA